MIFTVDMKALSGALALAGKVIETKSTMPVILNVRIATNDNRITLTGTNLDTTFEAVVPAEVATEGVTAVPFATLAAFCSAAKGERLTFEAKGYQVTVKSGRSRITLAAIDAADFPLMAAPPGDLVAVDAPTFTSALSFCAAAASDEEVRYYLNGPYLQETAEGAVIWGTDGHALHRAELPGLPSCGGGAIIPKDAVSMILSICDKATEARVLVTGRGWMVSSGDLRAWGKVIDGSFPDCNRVLSGFKDWEGFIRIGKDELTSALTVAGCGSDTMEKRSKAMIIKGQEGAPLIVRGSKAASGVISAGRAETMTPCDGNAALCVSSELLRRAITAMGEPEIALAAAGSTAIRAEPVQANSAVRKMALIMGIRASEQELADA